ncbi:MAG: hypothetical protein R3B70_44845, partial [Polyangiaceae bacterium]
MLRVLVTGFRPWTGVTYNPSGVVATRLHGARLSSLHYGHPHTATVRGIVLDVAWTGGTTSGGASVQSAAATLAAEATAYNPHLIVSFGVIPDESHVFDVEPNASDDSDYRDVLGNLPPSRRMHASDPLTLTLTFATDHIRDEMNRRLPSPFRAVSNPGLGSYLCERVAYEGARLQRLRAPPTGATTGSWIWASGFIHVPNPLHAAAGRSDADVSTLTTAQQAVFRTSEATIVDGARHAV